MQIKRGQDNKTYIVLTQTELIEDYLYVFKVYDVEEKAFKTMKVPIYYFR